MGMPASGHPRGRTRRAPRPSRWRLVAWGFAAATMGGASPVLAHPLGNFTANHYTGIEIGPEEVVIHYLLDLAEIPTLPELATMNRDGDPHVTPEERRAYLDERVPVLMRFLKLELDGAPLAPRVTWSGCDLVPGQGGMWTLRIALELRASIPPEGRGAYAELYYEDGCYPGRPGWKEIRVKPAGGVVVIESSAPVSETGPAVQTETPRDPRAVPRDLVATVRFGTGRAARTLAALRKVAPPGVKPRGGRALAACRAAIVASAALLAFAGGWNPRGRTGAGGGPEETGRLPPSRTLRAALLRATSLALPVPCLAALERWLPGRAIGWAGAAAGLACALLGFARIVAAARPSSRPQSPRGGPNSAVRKGTPPGARRNTAQPLVDRSSGGSAPFHPPGGGGASGSRVAAPGWEESPCTTTEFGGGRSLDLETPAAGLLGLATGSSLVALALAACSIPASAFGAAASAWVDRRRRRVRGDVEPRRLGGVRFAGTLMIAAGLGAGFASLVQSGLVAVRPVGSSPHPPFTERAPSR